MIISHKHRFVFIKTHKTAGTSVEIALSPFCGPEDVITPISAEDEHVRQQLGYPGPQNVIVPRARRTWRDSLRVVRDGKPTHFYNHASASFVRKRVDPSVWDDYFKFCLERNPWDKAVSLYYWRPNLNAYPTLTDFVQSRKVRRIRDWRMYARASGVIVDRVYKYEAIDEAMAELRDRLGLPETPRLPRAKSGYRRDKRPYREVLTGKDRDRIARLCTPEIAHLGYAWM